MHVQVALVQRCMHRRIFTSAYLRARLSLRPMYNLDYVDGKLS